MHTCVHSPVFILVSDYNFADDTRAVTLFASPGANATAWATRIQRPGWSVVAKCIDMGLALEGTIRTGLRQIVLTPGVRQIVLPLVR